MVHFLFVLALAKAVNSFARIGIELYLEADATNGLSLRTVNMTKSAYASINFDLDFFSSFVVKAKNADENHCKLSMKSCLGIFRNMKQVCILLLFCLCFFVNAGFVFIYFFFYLFRWNHVQSH